MTESNGCKKRVTCKRPHPNQRVHELLESLYRDAVKTKSHLVPALKEAISSLEKYPLPLSSGAECAILKGFDDNLCKYIDLHLNGQLSRNKKTKVTENGNSKDKRQGPSASVEESSDNEMASGNRKNRKKINSLVTNTEKCEFASKFGETISNMDNNVVSPDNVSKNSNGSPTQILNNHKSTKSAADLEKNNNLSTDCPDDVCSNAESMDTYFVNRSKRDALKNKPLIEVLSNNSPELKFTLCEDWENFTNADCNKFRKKYEEELKKRFPPVQILDEAVVHSSDGELVIEVSSSSDESVAPTQKPEKPQPSECVHNKVVTCKHCECISSAADAFQLYFKDKMKKDAEETVKCVLPRKMYKPAYRSGAYAILVALLEQRNECLYRDCLTKEELIQKAQKHTDQSFTSPKIESDYTAWTNMTRLVNKGLIQRISRNCSEDVYKLTAMGRAVSLELLKEFTPKVTVNDVIFHGQRNDRVPSLEDVLLIPPPTLLSVNEEQSSVFIEMPPGTFDIVMLIDKREQFNSTLPCGPNNCKYESRSLTIGDFLWVARSKKTGQELVLPHIVERKRMDDLASSITDGRFHEQKFRLRKCGLKNVIYLIESFRNISNHGLPASTLTQAVVNTGIQDEFTVVKTDGYDHTFQFLGKLSESLVHDFSPKCLRGCNRDTQGRELMTFEFFNKYSAKNKPLTVRDTFIKMLLQLRGLSVEKALAIANEYNTPRSLMKAYEKCNPKEGELLLSSLKFNHFTRTVGPTVSKTIYQMFSKLQF